MRERGFSLIEMLVVVAVFTVVTGAVFGLLDVTQQRYRTESEVLDAFQGARIALDQLTRDIHSTGFPPIKSLAAAQQAANADNIAYPFAWQPGYDKQVGLDNPCQVTVGALAGTCNTPNQWDLILEADIDPGIPGVEWIRYSLQNDTLFRAVVPKQGNPDPVAATNANLVPYVENVMNNASAADIQRIRASYPNLFPGGNPVPLFTYSLQTGCTYPPSPRAAVTNPPNCIREVGITMIVRSANLDIKTRQPRVITLTGLARRINPS